MEVLILFIVILFVLVVLSKAFKRETQQDRYKKIKAKKLADIEISEPKENEKYGDYSRRKISINDDIAFKKSDTNSPYYFFFDCETTGLPGDGKVVRIVQLSWLVLDDNFREVKRNSYYLNPGKPIPKEAIAIHRITDEIVKEKSKPHFDVLTEFYDDLDKCTWIIAHNFEFDAGRVDLETRKAKIDRAPLSMHKKSICTMLRSTKFCKLEPMRYGEYKWPKLEELAEECSVKVSGYHDSMIDVCVTAKCFEQLVSYGVIKRKGINL